MNDDITSLAFDCWANGGTTNDYSQYSAECISDAIDTGIISIKDDEICFADSEVLLRYATSNSISRLGDINNIEPTSIYNKLQEIHCAKEAQKHKLIGSVLAQLHNEKIIDIFTWAEDLIKTGLSVFELIFLLEHAFDTIENAEADRLYSFFTGQYENTKNDYMRHRLPQAITPWLENHQDVAKRIQGVFENSPSEEGSDIYLAVLRSFMHNSFNKNFQELISLSNTPNSLVSSSAIQALYSADYSSPERTKELDQLIKHCTIFAESTDESVVYSSTNTLCELVKHKESITSSLIEIAKQHNSEALFAISRFLFIEQDVHEDKSWYTELVNQLTFTNASDKGTLKNIDYILTKWVGTEDKKEIALLFINSWVRHQDIKIIKNEGVEPYFSSTIHRLFENIPLLQKAITEWLVIQDIKYPMIAQKMVQHLRIAGLSDLTLDINYLNSLDDQYMIFLVRRLLGFFSDDLIQINLIFSLTLVENAKDKTFDLVGSALINNIGPNYPGSTIDFLENKIADKSISKDIKKLCRDSCSVINRMQDDLRDLSDLHEFHPESLKVARFAKERQKQVSSAFDIAREDSIVDLIATKIPLKAGRKSFNRIHGSFSDPMELHPYSHSIQIPRSEIYDSVGAARERLLLKNTKLGNK